MYAVIGDLVASRQTADRARLQAQVVGVLDAVNAVVPASQPLQPTVGDEIQGVWEHLEQALAATFLVRLHLRPVSDIRFGVGLGEVAVVDSQRTPWIQDGSAWWFAREGLNKLGAARHSYRRSWFVSPSDPRQEALINSLLLTRDTAFDSLSDRALRILAMAISGAAQNVIAEREGISASAVSQQFDRGVRGLRDAYMEWSRSWQR